MIEWTFLLIGANGSELQRLSAQLVATIAALVASGGTCTLVALLLEAIEHGHLTELQACQEMGVSQSHWVNQKCGDGAHASIQRADRLPPTVKAWWGALVYVNNGPLPEIEKLARLHFGTRRMARMKLDQEQKKGVA